MNRIRRRWRSHERWRIAVAIANEQREREYVPRKVGSQKKKKKIIP